MASAFMFYFDDDGQVTTVMGTGPDQDQVLADLGFKLALGRRPGDPPPAPTPGRGEGRGAGLYPDGIRAPANGHGPTSSGNSQAPYQGQFYAPPAAVMDRSPAAADPHAQCPARPKTDKADGVPVCGVHGESWPSPGGGNRRFCKRQPSQDHPHWKDSKGFCNWVWAEGR